MATEPKLTPKCRILPTDHTEPLDWSWLRGFDVYAIGSPEDMAGNSFYHCLLYCLMTGFRDREVGTSLVSRSKMVKDTRIALASKIKEYHHLLDDGKMKDVGTHIPKYNIENMTEKLLTGKKFDFILLEYISLIYKTDIYILDKVTQDVVVPESIENLRRDRESIILLMVGDHYEALACKSKTGSFYTRFLATNDLIKAIRSRELKSSLTK